MKANKISASILAASLTELKKEIHLLNKLDIDCIHIDVMDGNFVPNISFGKDVVRGIKRHTNKPIKTHLMINNPERHVQDYIDAGSNTIIFHHESTRYHYELIKMLKDQNVRVGLALNPSTTEKALRYLHQYLDEILIMTVEPGFCGHKFLESQLAKIATISLYYGRRISLDIGVDGGVNERTAALSRKAGANLFIVGSYLFKEKNYNKNITKLRKAFLVQ